MRSFSILALAIFTACSGCRRTDIREITVEIPDLTESSRKQILDAFTIRKAGTPERIYEGIFPETFTFDFAKKTLTMQYDSMKIAQTNIRMLIADKGITVVFPTNTTGVAGYVDVKPKSVPAK